MGFREGCSLPRSQEQTRCELIPWKSGVEWRWASAGARVILSADVRRIAYFSKRGHCESISCACSPVHQSYYSVQARHFAVAPTSLSVVPSRFSSAVSGCFVFYHAQIVHPESQVWQP